MFRGAQVDRDRASRTIIASYKNAHSTFCEFVAVEEETKAVRSTTPAYCLDPILRSASALGVSDGCLSSCRSD